jgi:RNA polymerase sigma factor (sigma-70 family)
MPASELVERLDEFVAFARKRVRDPDLAAEVVQESLLKALTHIDQVHDDERLVAWYYRILRNAIADLVARLHRDRAVADVQDMEAPSAVDEQEACRCVARLLDELPPTYASALRSVEFTGATLDQAALAEGISVTNLKQRRLRAREQLRTLVHQTCRTCAQHGCLDCTCAQTGHGAHHLPHPDSA